MKTKRIAEIQAEIVALIADMRQAETEHAEALAAVHPSFADSARNLVHYRSLRQHDIRSLQRRLGNLGLSRLAKAQSHVLASLEAAANILESFLEPRRISPRRTQLTIKRAHKMLRSNARALLGYRSRGRDTRIMVTLPGEAATDYSMVRDLLGAGMNSARINCAHDDAGAWQQMIDNVRRATQELGRNCKICMDLAGPKIRTGPIKPGPPVLRFSPKQDVTGAILAPARVWLAPEPHPESATPHIPVSAVELEELGSATQLFFNDIRGRSRSLRISDREADGVWLECDRTVFLQPGVPLTTAPGAGRELRVGALPPLDQSISLQMGDVLRLHHGSEAGENARYNEDGELSAPAHIACTSAEVFRYVQPGETVLFDDGKIGSVVREARDDELLLEITHAKGDGSKLKADKGINFPQSRLQIAGLTAKDRADLRFVASNADVVNMSFVNSADDVRELLAELETLGVAGRLGVILKIETRAGFANLPEILLAAMHNYPLGVMIARGDLAVECGWDDMAWIQEEILRLCGAAHAPDIWATQVLENLAKKGIPSRAEITDAAMAQRADCVMLNKGPHIVSAIKMLDRILISMQRHQDKQAPLLPAIDIPDL